MVLKRFIRWLVLGYVGAGIGMIVISIIFFMTIGRQTAIQSVISDSGVEASVMPYLLVRSNQSLIQRNQLSEEQISVIAREVFDSTFMTQMNQTFSQQLHDWLRDGSGAFEFRYDASAQRDALRQYDPPLKTRFMQGDDFVISVDPSQSSIKIRLQHLYNVGRLFAYLGPLLFITLTTALFFLEQSKLLALYRLKRFFKYSIISVLFSIPINYAFWSFVANRLSYYPAISDVGAVTTRPLAAELLMRSSLIMLFVAIVYAAVFYGLKRYLDAHDFEPPPKQKHFLHTSLTKIIGGYLKKLR